MNWRITLPAVGLITALLCVPASAAEAPEISAAAAIVMDAGSGDTLYALNEDEPMLIASTTKIMTALIVLENCDPDALVAVEPEWTGIEGSSMYLKPGQELTIRDLLYGLMLASGNDAAVALACLTAGSVESFAERMNDKAAELGCENTHFANPNGLDDEEHYASAKDLARITREAIKNETFCRIVSERSRTVGENTYTNHNRLLTECEGVFGVKTGYTEAAGRTLVTCCERDGLTLICVTLRDPDDWEDHTRLYDWAYGSYRTEKILSPDDSWEIPVIGGERDAVIVHPEAELAVPRRDGQSVTVELRLPPFVYAAVDVGGEAGEATVYVDGEIAASTKLLYEESVARVPERDVTFAERIRAVLNRGERGIYTLE